MWSRLAVIAAASAFAVGCANNPLEPPIRTCNQPAGACASFENALRTEFEVSHGEWAGTWVETPDGKGLDGAGLQPGSQMLLVHVRWSNDFVEGIAVQFVAKPGALYRLSALEAALGEESRIRVTRVRSLGEAVKGGVYAGAIALWPLTLAAIGIGVAAHWGDKPPAPQSSASPGSSRPVSRSCFVWIEEWNSAIEQAKADQGLPLSGQVVWGITPTGVGASKTTH